MISCRIELQTLLVRALDTTVSLNTVYIACADDTDVVPNVGENMPVNYTVRTDIPTVSHWGLLAMTGLLASAGTVMIRRGREEYSTD